MSLISELLTKVAAKDECIRAMEYVRDENQRLLGEMDERLSQLEQLNVRLSGDNRALNQVNVELMQARDTESARTMELTNALAAKGKELEAVTAFCRNVIYGQ